MDQLWRYYFLWSHTKILSLLLDVCWSHFLKLNVQVKCSILNYHVSNHCSVTGKSATLLISYRRWSMWYKQGACIVCLDTVHYKEPCRFKQDVLLRIQLMAKKMENATTKLTTLRLETWQLHSVNITWKEVFMKCTLCWTLHTLGAKHQHIEK